MDKVGAEAYVAIDRFVAGRASGAVRIHSEAAMSEAIMLARGMGYKNAIFNIPAGGAKVSIRKRPGAADNSVILTGLLKALLPLILDRRLFLGPDMGVTEDEMIQAYLDNGLSRYISTSVLARYHGSVPLVRVATAHGVLSAIKVALPFASIEGSPAIAVEGFGKIGSEIVRQLHGSNFRLVAVSNRNGTLEDAGGVDIPTLLDYRKNSGDEALPRYARGRTGSTWKPNSNVYSSECDILLPGAGIFSFDSDSAHGTKAKLVVPFGNIALTTSAESVLFSRNVVALPYFLASGGGILSGTATRLGFSNQEVLSMVAEKIQAVVGRVLSESVKVRLPPSVIAVAMADRNVRIMSGLGEVGSVLAGWWRCLPRSLSRNILSRATW